MSEVNHLMGIVEQLFLPQMRPQKIEPMPVPTGDTAVEQAFAGFCLAANAVTHRDYDQHLRDWEDRQNRLIDWREHLKAHPIPDSAESAAAIQRGEMTVSQALMGTDRWEEMMDDLAEMLRWSSTRHEESARKLRVTSDAGSRAIAIRQRGEERVKQIVKSSTRKINRLNDDDTARRDEIIASGQSQVADVAEVVVNRTNALTRQVLDLDENTAHITTADWLRQHGLDAVINH